MNNVQPIFDPKTHYQMEVRGLVDAEWLQSFDIPAEIIADQTKQMEGITVLDVHTDQSGIVGLVRMVHRLGMTILQLQIVPDGANDTDEVHAAPPDLIDRLIRSSDREPRRQISGIRGSEMTTTGTTDQYSPTQGNDRLALELEKSQYSFWQILGIWLAAGAPMWILGWLVYPVLSQNLSLMDAGSLRIKLLTAGLIWQFMLSMLVLYKEEGNIRIETIRRRFWLNAPISPKTGQKNNRLWWLVLPLILLVAAMEAAIGPVLNSIWTNLFPFLAEPQGYSMAALFAPDLRANWIGAWNLMALMVVFSVFNTFLGEEFLFRGVLLPKMDGAFGRWDWAANGVLFGLYHLHQPWGLPGNILSGLLFAFTGKRFRSNWFPILLHSGQSVFILFLILGLILGLA